MDVDAEIGLAYTVETWTASHAAGRSRTSQSRQSTKNSHDSPTSGDAAPLTSGSSKIAKRKHPNAFVTAYDTDQEEPIELKPELEKIQDDMQILELEGNFKRRFHGKVCS